MSLTESFRKMFNRTPRVPQGPPLELAQASARDAFALRHPKTFIAWTKPIARHDEKIIVAVYYGETVPPSCQLYEVKPPMYDAREVEDASLYQPQLAKV